MREYLAAITFCLLIIVPLEAWGTSVEVTLTGEELVETKPGHVVTAVLRIANNTPKNLRFIPHVNLPVGWSLITKALPSELPPNQSDINLLSFFVPQRTLADTYEVSYSVEDKDHAYISNLCTLHVTVLPVAALGLEVLNTPEYVVAGDRYEVSFLVKNDGNVKVSVSIEIRSGENLPSSIDAKSLQLSAGESKTVTVVVETDTEIRAMLNHSLELTAQALEYVDVKSRKASSVEIIPRVSGIGQRYHTIPIYIATSGHVFQKEKKVTSAFQTEISGSGMLDEEARKYVDFLFRLPDARGKSTFGKYDEYRFSFRTENYELGLGDSMYPLSSLLGGMGHGRGAKGKLAIGNLSLGTCYQIPRWATSEKRSVSGQAIYSLGDKHSIGFNYLMRSKNPSGVGIVSLHGRFKPTRSTDVELEGASGENDYAYLMRINGNYRLGSYFLKLIHAGPDYPGIYRDIQSLSANAAVPIWKRLNLNTSFHQSKNNINMSSARPARLERFYQFSLNCAFAANGSLSLQCRNRTHRDRFPQTKYSSQERIYGLKTGYSFQKLSIDASIQAGRSRDHITGKSARQEQYNISTYLRLARWQSCHAYIRYYDTNSDSDYMAGKRDSITAGLSNSFRMGRTSFRASSRVYQYEYLRRDRKGWSVETSLTHMLRNKHKISVRNRYTSFDGSDKSVFMTEYTTPFGLPVSRKKGAGALEGYVYNQETGKPIADVILKISNVTALTDEKGRFSFPFLKPGIYYLDVNAARIGMNLISVQETPIEVVVEGDKEASIEIHLMRRAALFGQIVVYRPDAEDHYDRFVNGRGPELVPSHGLANILVEIADGTEIERRLTDGRGRFSFEEIVPGKWTLKIYDYDLPEYHYIERDTFEFELKPDATEVVSIKVLPKKRRIHIMEEGGIIQEEEKSE